MCGRLNLRSNLALIVKQFNIEVWDNVEYEPRYNLPPTLRIPVIRQADGKRQVSLMRWGLIPSWAKDLKKVPLNNNARGETVAEKASFRTAFKKRRCIVPADGFYEWETIGKEKLPYYIYRTDGKMMAMAGIWESWHDPEKADEPPLDTCAIVTIGPNAIMEPIHERMPVILSQHDCATWLDPAATELQHLIEPCPADEITAHRVSKFVNKVGNESEECVEPIMA